MTQDGSAGTAVLGLGGFVLLAMSSAFSGLEQAMETTAMTAWCQGCEPPRVQWRLAVAGWSSRGWRTEAAELADDVRAALESAGLQLVGDAEDQPSRVESRILHILEDCGAFAAILPYRMLSTPRTSKYVLREWELAAQLGLPCLVVADPRVGLPSDVAGRTGLLGTPAPDGATPSTFGEAAAGLAEDWLAPARSHHVFYAYRV